MRAISVAVYDSWPKPNYVDPVTRGPALYYVNGTFFALATIAVFLRLYTRIFVRKWFGIDDATILAAWVCASWTIRCRWLTAQFFGLTDMTTVFYAYRHFYWDRHMWDANPLSFTR
jgi:hypothetical protein